MYTLKYILTSFCCLVFLVFALLTAMMWGFESPGPLLNGIMLLKTVFVIGITIPGLLIFIRNMSAYERKADIIRDMEDEKLEGPMLFDPQNHRNF